MCGRFTLSTDTQKIAEVFRLGHLPVIGPRYNIAPTQPVACVRIPAADGERRLEHLQWGLVPPWASRPDVGASMINARSETIDSKPAFKHAFRRRRCLIVADGFYEWEKIGRNRRPHYIALESGEPFGFAGILEHYQDEHGSELETCAIITCGANELLAPLHHRMPVILPPDVHDAWLDPEREDVAALRAMLGPFPQARMQRHLVGPQVNRVGNDDPSCIEPVESEWLFGA